MILMPPRRAIGIGGDAVGLEHQPVLNACAGRVLRPIRLPLLYVGRRRPRGRLRWYAASVTKDELLPHEATVACLRANERVGVELNRVVVFLFVRATRVRRTNAI